MIYKTRIKGVVRYLLIATPLFINIPSGIAQNIPVMSQTAPTGSVPGELPTNTPSISPSISGKYNYIRAITPVIPVTDEQNVSESSDPATVRVTTTFNDGMNSPMQTIIKNFTTNANNDLVRFTDASSPQDNYNFLPYAKNDNSSTLADPNASYILNPLTEQKIYYNSLFPHEHYTSFSKRHYISDANQRSVIDYSPGRTMVGQNRGTTTQNTSNDASKVKMWSLNGSGMPVSSGYYPQDQLYSKVTTSVDGGESITYTDKDGTMVCKFLYLKDNTSGGITNKIYATTYYVYDDFGKLRYTIPPAATDLIANGTLTATQLNNLCFQYTYNNRGQIIEQKSPGKAVEYTVYDKKNRPVFTQDGILRGQNLWSFTTYDQMGRQATTGQIEQTQSRVNMQALALQDPSVVSNNSIFYYICNYNLDDPYSIASVLPDNILGYTYYDNYNVMDPTGVLWNTFASTLQFSEMVSTPGSETPTSYSKKSGYVTGTKTRILQTPGVSFETTGKWRETVNYYDDKGRIFYSVAKDVLDGIEKHVHYTGTQYSFTNQVLVTKHIIINNNSTDANNKHTELERNLYESVTGRLYRNDHKIDNGNWNIAALYTYNDLGQVSRKVLGNYGEVQDYTYNIRGQQTAINGVYAETGDKQGESRTFGSSLKYDYGFTKIKYDGSLSGILWRGSTVDKMYAYGYDYDKSNRMISADFRNQLSNGNWDKTHIDYSVVNLSYDNNGNIQHMEQRGMGVVSGNVVPVDMDVLSYSYTPESNNLAQVHDTQNQDFGNGDFQDGSNSDDDYSYDLNGNPTKDQNKGISDIVYNNWNKPQIVTFGSGTIMLYTYDAKGIKIQESITNTNSNKQTDYIGNFVYENNKLQFALTNEGRSVYNQTNGTFTEEYFVKDHLGNVRSIVNVVQYPITQYMASYEVASSNLESLVFDNIDDIRDEKPDATPDNTMAANLNGSDPNRRVGSSMLLKVMAGDKLELNANSYYENYDMGQDVGTNREDLLGSIVSTLTGGIGGFVGSESHNTKLVEQAFTGDNFTNFNQMIDGQRDISRPQAYLNYVLFDENMQLVREGSGAFQAAGQGGWASIGTSTPMTIPTNGYIAVYLSNATQNISCDPCGDVYFDQLVVRFTRGQLIEESHYYPFGLPMAGMGSAAVGGVENKHKYQSNEFNRDLGLNWMDFNNRQYDPQLGRFMGIDPLAVATDMVTPYAGMNNNPVMTIDPMGLIGITYPTAKDQYDIWFSLTGTHKTDNRYAPGPETEDRLNDETVGYGWGIIKAAEAREKAENDAKTSAQGDGNNDDQKLTSGHARTSPPLPPLRVGDAGHPLDVYYFQLYQKMTSQGMKYGLDIEISYQGDISQYTDVDWIQIVTTSNPSPDSKNIRLPNVPGYDGDGSNGKFYYGGKGTYGRSIADEGDQRTGGKYFYDSPGKPYGLNTWYGELSLVGKLNGTYQTIVTYSYGFMYFGGLGFILPLTRIR